MKVIYKYALNTGEPETRIDLPRGAKVVAVRKGDDLEEPRLWIEQDTDNLAEIRTFRIFGTGHNIPHEWKHVATFFDDPFVWHLYEKGSPYAA